MGADRVMVGAVIGAASLIMSSGVVGAGMAGGAHQGPMAAQAPAAHAPTQAPTTTTAPQTGQPTTLSPAHTTGQPNANCETLGNQPGNSISAPGSAFNPSGTSGGVYAGEQTQNSRNTASASQYDVACARSH
jgi:hypothetical protein